MPTVVLKRAPKGIRGLTPDKPRKYRNVPTKLDGVRFDSKAEARRYAWLAMSTRGVTPTIIKLKVHPRFPLFVGTRLIGSYEADFSYTYIDHDGKDELVIEDVKGGDRDTALSAWKRRHFEAQYGIAVTVVRVE